MACLSVDQILAKTGVRWVTDVGWVLTHLPIFSSVELAAGTARPQKDQTDLPDRDVRLAGQNSRPQGSAPTHKPHTSFGRFRPINGKTAALLSDDYPLGSPRTTHPYLRPLRPRQTPPLGKDACDAVQLGPNDI